MKIPIIVIGRDTDPDCRVCNGRGRVTRLNLVAGRDANHPRAEWSRFDAPCPRCRASHMSALDPRAVKIARGIEVLVGLTR